MFIKVWKTTFRLCENLSPTLRDCNTRMGSWLPALAATTNQPFEMHFGHVHIPASSPYLPPLLGPRFLLAPIYGILSTWPSTLALVPLSCLDLSITSTSNSGSLWTRSRGGLELCYQLSLEASRVTNFKSETWNMGWILRFSGSF
jgi:hypothetical protein